MATLREWNAMGKWSLLARLSGIGALAGVAVWPLAYVLHLLFGMTMPPTSAFLLAIPRGALYGAILAVISRVYFKRLRRRDEGEL